ncbi:amino acid ABC transporter substrate-binding protein [Fundidesulfovibrio butyratiphilus]
MRRVLCSVIGLLLVAASASAGEVFNAIKSAKSIHCGVSTGVQGFSERGPDGRWRGLDVDFCRAVAAAVLGDPEKAAFKPLPSLARFPALMSGEIDLLARNTTWTLSRESGMGVSFVGPLLFTRQGVMVRKADGFRRPEDLSGAVVAVVKNSTQEIGLDFWSTIKSIRSKNRFFDSNELALESYLKGECQGLASDVFLLEAMRHHAPDGADKHMILVENNSMAPLSPAVRSGDRKWLLAVRAVWACLLLAEEMELTQASFADAAAPTPMRLRFNSRTDSVAKSLGLEPGWAARAVAAVGSYGEMFERNLGSGSSLHLERGPNRLWSKGGLMIPPLF